MALKSAPNFVSFPSPQIGLRGRGDLILLEKSIASPSLKYNLITGKKKGTRN